jgi:prepilin-type N-terminal cleavage/methylation domain-containing protein
MVDRMKLGRNGFTLMEVVIALVILVAVMAGTYQAISFSARSRAVTRARYIAVVLANNRIERAKNFKYADLSLLAESDVVVDGSGSSDPDGQFRRTTVINPNFANNVTEIIATVQIRKQDGTFADDRAETVRTLLTRYVGEEE